MNTKTKRTSYWIATGLLAFSLLSGGAAELMHRPENIEGVTRLGYPVYFIVILGFWKVAGAIALLIPRFPRLKEWAYAGSFFNMTGAAVSHAVCHDSPSHLVGPLVLAALTVASWALRPPSRRLGEIMAEQTSG